MAVSSRHVEGSPSSSGSSSAAGWLAIDRRAQHRVDLGEEGGIFERARCAVPHEVGAHALAHAPLQLGHDVHRPTMRHSPKPSVAPGRTVSVVVADETTLSFCFSRNVRR